MGISRVTKKGQITLRRSVREKLGLKPGSRVDVRLRGKEVLIRKVEEKSIVDSMAGTVEIEPAVVEKIRKELEKRLGETD